ncbi:MAG: hypothetical protein AAGC81_17100 [Pseudomonadota bacterium]
MRGGKKHFMALMGAILIVFVADWLYTGPTESAASLALVGSSDGPTRKAAATTE